jgi:transcriptional regulator with XRE-family HTH domain
MAPRRRTADHVEGVREATALGATLGRELRTTRRRRRLTRRQLGDRIELSQTEISFLERGHGSRTPIETWVTLGIALDRPFAAGFSRDAVPEPSDAGHLAAQELLLRLARAQGRAPTFELPTKPSDPSHSADVGIRDDQHRVLCLVAIWNRLDDLGRATRSTDRKVVEAADLAAFRNPPYHVASCWLLVDTAANRRLVRTCPATLRARFPGSSLAWVHALTGGSDAPRLPGLCWIDPRAGRITAVRYHTGTGPSGP